MPLQVVRGKERSPVKAVIYGTEGVGKTTLAAQWPSPLILDTEKGSKQLDVARVHVKSWQDLMTALRELAVDTHGAQTVVIDSLDWAEKLCKQHVCQSHGKKSLEDWPYGKGLVLWAETFSTLLDAADRLVELGLHVVLVAHSKSVRVAPPDQTEGYDRYELDLDKRNAPGAKEWADLLLFLNYRTKVIEGSDGRARGIGGKDRVMFAERAAAYDAKNRFGLPAEMPVAFEHLAGLFTDAPKPASDLPLFDAISGFIAKAQSVKSLGKTTTRIDQLLSDGQITDDEWSRLTDLVDARHEELDPSKEDAADVA